MGTNDTFGWGRDLQMIKDLKKSTKNKFNWFWKYGVKSLLENHSEYYEMYVKKV